MAKLILLLAIACFQFSQQKELSEAEKLSDEVLSAVKVIPSSDLADFEDHWFKKKGRKYDEKWTEEDEKWFQEIQSLSEDSDEDYDDDLEEILNLIVKIEEWIEKSHPEKNKYRWLKDIKELFDDFYDYDWDLELSHYPNYMKKEKNAKVKNMALDEKDNLDLYYSWLYRMKLKNVKNEKVQPTKRFSSV